MKQKKDTRLPLWNRPESLDFLVELLILIVIFIMPTIFDRRLGIVFSGTKTAFMRLFGILLLSLWSIKLLVFRQHKFVRTVLDWPVVSYLLATTVATITSVHVYVSLAGFYGRYEGLTSWYLFGLFFFVVTNFVKSFDQLKRIIITILSASTLMAIYSIIQRHSLDPYMWGGVLTWQRVIGTIGQPNFLAAYILMAFFILLSFFLLSKKPLASKKQEWTNQILPLSCFLLPQIIFLFMLYSLQAYNVFAWYLGFSLITLTALLFSYTYQQLQPILLDVILGLCLVLNYICILYTQSRGGYMGLFVGGVVFFLVAGRQLILPNWKKLAVLGALIVLISGITMLRPEFSPFERFASEVTTKKVVAAGEEEHNLELKGAAGSRGETWKSAFRIIADYPVFGTGPEVLKMVFPRYETDLFRFKEAFHVKQDRCHNETFDVSVTKGLVTLFVYLWLLFLFFKVGVRKALVAPKAERFVLAGLLAGAVSYLVQNQFSFGVVAITSLFWIIWGLVMVVARGLSDEPASQGKPFSWDELPWLSLALVGLVTVVLIYFSFFSFRADIWFKSGKTNLELGRFPQAIDDLNKSLGVYPFEGGTISHLGIALINLAQSGHEPAKNINGAAQALKYGTLVDAYNADNFYILAKISLSASETGNLAALAQAEEYAIISLKIDPYYAEVYQVLAQIKERQGKLEEAANDLEQCFLINPNLVQPLQQLEALNRRRGKTMETLKVLEHALAKYRTNLVFLENIGRINLEFGQIEAALSVAQRMITLDPASAAAYLIRGIAEARQGKTEQAFLDFQQVIMFEPENISAHGELGKIYLRQGNKERAKEEFGQMLVIDPSSAAAKELLR